MSRAARTYRKVEPAMWHADSFRALSAPKPNAQTLWTYLITGPRTIAIPGVVVARPAVMADDLRWSRRGFDAAMAEIVAAGMAEIDPEVGLVVLTRALIHDGQPRNTSRPNSIHAVKTWVGALIAVPACSLRDVLAERLAMFMSLCGGEFPNAYAEATGQTCTQSAGERPSRRRADGETQDQEKEKEQEQEQEQDCEPAKPVAPAPADPVPALWSKQEAARASVPGTRPLKLTPDRRREVAARVREHGEDGCSAALDEYIAEARRTGDWQWLNGETNWRAKNVARQLGRIGTARAGPRAGPPASSIDATAQALRDRGFLE